MYNYSYNLTNRWLIMANSANPASNAPKYRFDFTPASKVKMPWTALAEAIQCLWRSFYYTVFHSKVNVPDWDQKKQTESIDPNFVPALCRFKKIGTLDDTALNTYFEGLSENSNGRVGVVLGHAVWGQGKTLPERNANQGLLFIPIVIKGFLRDHVVLLTVNFKTETVDYFDPQGLKIAARPDATAISGEKLTDIVTNAAIKYFSKRAITSKDAATAPKEQRVLSESTVRHQEDWYNCGMHVLDFATRYSKEGAAFEDLIKRENRLRDDAANGSRRAEFIDQLVKRERTEPLVASSTSTAFQVNPNGDDF